MASADSSSTDTPPETKKTGYSFSFTGPPTTAFTGIAAMAEEDTPRVRWQWKDNSGWKDYDDVTQTILESAHSAGMPSVELTHDFFGAQGGYTIDFLTLIQTKNASGYKRQVKRVGLDGKEVKAPDPKWEYKEPSGKWIEVDRTTFLLIEGTINRRKTTLVLNHGKWLEEGRYDVDFLNNTLSRRKPKKTRMPLRRVPPLSLDPSSLFSGAEPETSASPEHPTTMFSAAPREKMEALDSVVGVSPVTAPLEADDKGTLRKEASTCAVCRAALWSKKDAVSDVVHLPNCDKDHFFHRNCIAQLVRGTEIGSGYLTCPVCHFTYGTRVGIMPEGTFSVTRYEKGHGSYTLPGFEEFGTIQCNFNFPSGTQGPEHPHPGVCFDGTSRVAYLPDNEEGQTVLKLFQIAWDRRLMFTIARSVTTGKDNQVVWNGIHCKTAIHGGKTQFGYPDEGYITRVMSELFHQGVTPACLETHDFSKPFSGKFSLSHYVTPDLFRRPLSR